MLSDTSAAKHSKLLWVCFATMPALYTHYGDTLKGNYEFMSCTPPVTNSTFSLFLFISMIHVRSNGQTHQAFSVAISVALNGFEGLVAELESKYMTKFTSGKSDLSPNIDKIQERCAN